MCRERQEQGEFVGRADFRLYSAACWGALSLCSDCSVTQGSPSGREGGGRPELHTELEMWGNHGFMQWHELCLALPTGLFLPDLFFWLCHSAPGWCSAKPVRCSPEITFLNGSDRPEPIPLCVRFGFFFHVWVDKFIPNYSSVFSLLVLYVYIYI